MILSNRKGIALLIVVAVVIVLTILSSVILSVLSNQTRYIEHNIARTKAKYATEAAMVRSLDRLRRTDTISSVHSVSGSHDNPDAYLDVYITNTTSSSFPDTSQLNFNLDYDPLSTLSETPLREEREPVIINSFSVDQSTSVDSGTKVTLAWSTSNAALVTIDQGIGSVKANGEENVRVYTTTIFTLTATNEISSTTATVKVVVKPTITNFSAYPSSTSSYGTRPTLVWNTTNTDSVTIEPDTGCSSLGTNSYCTVYPAPTSDTTYTLTAIGEGGTATKPVTFSTNVSLSIDSFTADPDTIRYEANCDDSQTVLSWLIYGALTIDISPGVYSDNISVYKYSGSKTVNTGSTTIYTLTATGYNSQTASKSIEVEFIPCSEKEISLGNTCCR